MLLLSMVIACVHLANAHCTLDDINNPSIMEDLIGRLLVAGSQESPPGIHLQEQKIVCLAVDNEPGTYRLASLIVQYICDGIICPNGT